MTSGAKHASEPVRLLFEMTRDDNPRLYDDLLAQQWMTIQGGAVAMIAPARPLGEANVSAAVARQTNQAFEVPAGGEA